MNRILLLLFTLVGSSSLMNGQSISVSTGIGTNQFYELSSDHNTEFNFEGSTTKHILISFHNKDGAIFLKDTYIKATQYSGAIFATPMHLFCGVGVSSSFLFTSEKINKYAISFGSLPLSLNLGKIATLKAGLEFSKYYGGQSEYYSPNEDPSNPRTDAPFISSFTNQNHMLNAIFRVEFIRLSLSNSISIYPTYHATAGLIREFKNTDVAVRSIRHSIGLAVDFGI